MFYGGSLIVNVFTFSVNVYFTGEIRAFIKFLEVFFLGAPLKVRLCVVCDRLNPEEQSYFRPL